MIEIDYDNKQLHEVFMAQQHALFITIGRLEATIESLSSTPEEIELAERLLAVIKRELAPVLKS